MDETRYVPRTGEAVTIDRSVSGVVVSVERSFGIARDAFCADLGATAPEQRHTRCLAHSTPDDPFRAGQPAYWEGVGR